MNDPSVKSYRYLRIGMVGAVGLLAMSIGLERLGVDCWQTSISGYYYTPVRAIFVGALMAIGLSLVVVKGRTEVEDALLNVAGMLAPVVAVVPTTEVVTCWSVPPAQFPVDATEFATVFEAAIRNNMGALLITAAVGLVVAAVLGQRTMGSARAAVRELQPGSRWGLAAAVVLVVVTTAALLWWPGFPTHAHDIAAGLMFVCLAAAVWFNGREGAKAQESTYPTTYRTIALVMVAPAVLLLPFFNGFDHRVFVVEAIEIASFATFWILQTRQFWTREVAETDHLPHFDHP